MTEEIKEKLATSLTAETTELLPFLPYLLQDFWELGSDPDVMLQLVHKHIDISDKTHILDLACGKGAVSIKISAKLKVKIKGIDIIPEFIDYAVGKARELNVDSLCNFLVGDVNEAVAKEKNYDCVILGAVGNVLGSVRETLTKLKETIKTGGYILLDDAYVQSEADNKDIKYKNCEYLTKQQWSDLFRETGLVLIEAVHLEDGESSNPSSELGMEFITKRVNELIEKYPNKKDIFEDYIRSQQNEYDDIDNNLVCVTWILKKI